MLAQGTGAGELAICTGSHHGGVWENAVVVTVWTIGGIGSIEEGVEESLESWCVWTVDFEEHRFVIGHSPLLIFSFISWDIFVLLGFTSKDYRKIPSGRFILDG